MGYPWRSLATFSFWRYALFSGEALAKLLAVVGALYLFMEIMDFLSIYTKDKYDKFAIFPMLAVAVLFVVFTRRPVSRVTYKVPSKDYRIEVKIANLFAEPCDIVISTSTTFDTDVASGLIAKDSLQGQLVMQLFEGKTVEIDRQLGAALKGIAYTDWQEAPGKKSRYPIGTVAPVRIPGRTFYFVAMSQFNETGTAKSSLRDIETALESLWEYVTSHGELRDIAMPLMGTGRGRIALPRKKMVERIAQSFADASREKVFSNRLVVVIRPQDAEDHGVSLFEVKDYLARNLHA
jgi:hypothetical protein